MKKRYREKRKRIEVTDMITTILNYPHDKSYCLFIKDLIEIANDPRVDMM